MSDIYQDFIMEIYQNPLNAGRIDDAKYKAHSHNPLCGDNIELFIKTNSDGKITDIKYYGKGCAISQVSASLVTEHLKGKTIDQAKKMKKEDVLKLIKIDLSKNPSRMKCALLILDVLGKTVGKD
jgi:nitrogen fixation NifU-like protein